MDDTEKLTQEKVWEFILLGDEDFDLESMRRKFKISAESSVFYTSINRFVTDRKLRRLGRARYHRVTRVEPVRVFLPGRERRPLFDLRWPLDRTREMEIDLAEFIVLREGDLITIGGVKSKCKTLLCMNFCASNIDRRPVLMGNEYTVFVDGKFDPAPRFLSRLDRMATWVDWVDGDGNDKFMLLPVREDYAEHVVKNRINIVDWISLDADKSYDIGKVLFGIKSAVGRGIAIGVLQKGEGNIDPRGGQFVRDFSDVELMLDGYGDNTDDVLLTVRGAKETTAPIVGKTYAFTAGAGGTEIHDFREVKKCVACRGSGYTKGGVCDSCSGKKFIDK